MAINPSIPLQAQPANPLNALAQGYQLGNAISQAPMQKKLNEQKLAAGEIDIQNAKVKQQETLGAMAKTLFQSEYYGAEQIAPYLEAGDMDSVIKTIEQRKQAKQFINMPTDIEDSFLAQLQKDPTAAKATLAKVLENGRRVFGARQKTGSPKVYQTRDGVFALSPDGVSSRLGDLPLSSIDQQAAIDAERNAAIAKLLAGKVGGDQPDSAPPSPTAPAGSSNPFANMSEEEIKNLPPDVLKKYLETKTDPKNISNEREKKADTTRAVQSAKLFIETLQDPEIKSATGPAAILGTANRALGTQAGVIAGRLERLGNKLTLEANSLLKGATTDRDIKFLQGTMPSKYDSVEVWADWYENDYLGTIKANAEANGLDFNSYGLPSTIEANKAPIETNKGWSIKKVQ